VFNYTIDAIACFARRSFSEGAPAYVLALARHCNLSGACDEILLLYIIDAE